MPQMPVNENFYTGRGINSTTGKVFRVAIKYDEPQSENSGQKTIMTLESITSSHSLSTSLSVSVSASMNSGAWGGSAGFKMMQSREVNSYYTYALVKTEVRNPPQLLRNPRLTQEAEAKLQEGWDAFVSLYGDEYIEGIVTGGTYYAMIEIQTKDDTQQRDVSAKLSGSYGSFSGSAKMKSTFKEISKTYVLNVFVIQSGGSGDILETTLDEMIEQAVNFPALVKESPVDIFAITNDYQSTVSLPNIPPPDSLLRINQRDHLHDLGTRYLKLKDYKSSIQFVLDNLIEFDDFRGFSAEQLKEKREEFTKSLDDTAHDLDMIVRKATRCADDATQCEPYVPTATILPLPTIGGKLMNLKKMEERLNALQKELEKVKSTADSANKGQSNANKGVTEVKSQIKSTLNQLGRKDILTGIVKKNYYRTSHPMAAGSGSRTDTIHVDFPSGKFSSTPQVAVMLNSVDSGRLRLTISAKNVKSTGFDIVIGTWANSRFDLVTVTWIAFTE